MLTRHKRVGRKLQLRVAPYQFNYLLAQLRRLITHGFSP
ncbi:hypothetical protein ppKF707_4424 [Metapseudomonas furukawaii]|nr:hypothetical protein ppKF707_4424 [Pseudomonas furukawaii]